METLSAFSLPPGFGFHPTDVELISHYLKKKILGHKIEFEVIPEVDIYKHEPWDLPAKSHIPTRDCRWHFFTSRGRKYPNGSRSNRATEAGYWKSTGKDRNIRFQNRVIGTKKTLVFHEGRPPCGKRSDWIMHEYYLNENEWKQASGIKDVFVLCRVTKRDGLAKEDDEVPSTQLKKSGNSCVPLPNKSSPNQLEDVFAPVLKKEEQSSSENVVDYEAWLRELYDPNYGSTLVSEPKSELKVDPSSLFLKQEPMEPYFSPSLLEDTFFLPSEGDGIYSILGNQFDPEFGYDLFGDVSFEASDAISVHQFNADRAIDYPLPPVFAARKCIENNVPVIYPTYSAGLLAYHGKMDEQDQIAAALPSFSRFPSNIVDTGIQILEQHGRVPNEIPSHRIHFQVHKMESRNPGPINQTFLFDSKDHHLDLNNELNQVSFQSNTTRGSELSRDPTASNQVRTQVDEKLQSGKASSSPISNQTHTVFKERIHEKNNWEAPSSKASSKNTHKASPPCSRTSAASSKASRFSRASPDEVSKFRGVFRGFSLFIRRCLSMGLNCLFPVTRMMRTAA